MHFCICHESSLTVVIDLIYHQCSGVVDGTRYIMPNTMFRIFVISGYMQLILSTSIVIMYSRILMKCYTLKIPR